MFAIFAHTRILLVNISWFLRKDRRKYHCSLVKGTSF